MFYNIQTLRGIAALLVVMHHALPHFRAMDLSNIVVETIGKYGYMGVDVFFVISGFVMAKTSIGKKQGMHASFNFLAKRFLRIFLGFWPILGLTLLYYYYLDAQYLINKNILQSFLLINPNMINLVISPAWSLTYELFFYVLVAILLTSIKLKAKILFPLLILTVVFKNIFTDAGDFKFLDFFFSSLLLEFIGGYFLFYFLDKISNRGLLIYALLLGAVSLGLATYYNIGYGYVRVLTFGVFAISLVWLFLILEVNKILVFSGLIRRIGDASYTLYLTHTVLLGAFYTLGIRDYLVKNNFAMIGFISFLVFMVVSSIVFYKYIELPLYKFTKRKLLTK